MQAYIIVKTSFDNEIRKGLYTLRDFIITYTGKTFYPLTPVPEDIDIRDIAHSQSYMTRANGHMMRFYSVAQHSINCALEAAGRGHSPRVQLACLLHDASESYISDITRPVKKAMPQYLLIESRLMEVIYRRFGLADLDREEQQQISEIDDDMLYHEFVVLKNIRLNEQQPTLFARPDFSEHPFSQVERQMLTLFEQLWAAVHDSYSSEG